MKAIKYLREVALPELNKFCHEFVKAVGPPSAVDSDIGKLESVRAVSGDTMLSHACYEVIVDGTQYLVKGSMSGLKTGTKVVLREWPGDPRCERYLIIDGRECRVV